jgi:hypothetical protein
MPAVDADRLKVAIGGAVVIGALALAWRFRGTPPPEPTSTPTITTGSARTTAANNAPESIPAPRVASSTVEGAARFAWGSGDDELGRNRRKEGNAEGPMSLAIDKDGSTLLLDQVNGRLVRRGRDGKLLKSIGLPVQGAQDVAIGDDGKIAVLDRLIDKTVAIMGPDGNVIGKLPLDGPGIGETGGVTGVFVDGKKVYAEYEHGMLVLLGDTSGNPDKDRTEMPGRPSRDGQYLWSAGITDADAGILWIASLVRASAEHRFTKQLKMGMPVRTIRLLDTDKQGIVYLAAGVEAAEEAILLTCIAPLDGHVLGSVQLPASAMPEESFRDFAVLDEGGVLYQFRTEQGVTVSKYDCR